jgi:hypothetical protein
VLRGVGVGVLVGTGVGTGVGGAVVAAGGELVGASVEGAAVVMRMEILTLGDALALALALGLEVDAGRMPIR